MKKNRYYEIETYHNNVKISQQRAGMPQSRMTYRRHQSGMFEQGRGLVARDTPRTSGILSQLAGLVTGIAMTMRGLSALDKKDINKKINDANNNKYSDFIRDIKNNPQSITKNISTCSEKGAKDFTDIIDRLSRDPDLIDDELNPTTRKGFKSLQKLYKNYLILSKKCSKKSTASINKTNFNVMNKKADQYSNKYYQDAVKDSGNDAFMKTFYKEMSSEYEKKIERKVAERKDLMDFFYEQEHIMHQAHPNSTYVADAIGHGGLVENGVESHNILKNIGRKKPTGNNF